MSNIVLNNIGDTGRQIDIVKRGEPCIRVVDIYKDGVKKLTLEAGITGVNDSIYLKNAGASMHRRDDDTLELRISDQPYTAMLNYDDLRVDRKAEHFTAGSIPETTPVLTQGRVVTLLLLACAGYLVYRHYRR
jgi:hypothetical protein